VLSRVCHVLTDKKENRRLRKYQHSAANIPFASGSAPYQSRSKLLLWKSFKVSAGEKHELIGHPTPRSLLGVIKLGGSTYLSSGRNPMGMGMITLIFVVVIVSGYLLAATKGGQPIAVSPKTTVKPIAYSGRSYPFSKITDDANFPHVRSIHTKIRGVTKEIPME